MDGANGHFRHTQPNLKIVVIPHTIVEHRAHRISQLEVQNSYNENPIQKCPMIDKFSNDLHPKMSCQLRNIRKF